MKKKSAILAALILATSLLFSCSKCYECTRQTSSTSSKRGACFDTVKEAKSWKKDMENSGFDCRIVPEDSF